MSDIVNADFGSFRDPAGRVYTTSDGRILRGLNKEATAHCKQLLQQSFFQKWAADGKVVKTAIATDADLSAFVLADGWDGVFEHAAIDFISYPYEWTFSMLKDAALLQLELLETSMKNGWTIKDATPYNIQWRGANPIFIDILSFVPVKKPEPWLAYRQFCMLFLYPLMLKAHLDIDFNRFLRADLDGLAPTEAALFFRGWRRFLSGVIAHVHFPATVERSIIRHERNRLPAKKRTVKPQTEAMIFGLVQSMFGLVSKLNLKSRHSAWSHYESACSYGDDDRQAKRRFIERNAACRQRQLVWDLGANTGEFSNICAQYADTVVAADGDIDTVERLYLREKQSAKGNILPLVLNLANLSPGQGWGGVERAAFDRRRRPDLVLCLALAHHLRISANIPMSLFLDWLQSLRADVIVEFVGREDEMTKKLLLNKKEQYADYNLIAFEEDVHKRFIVKDTLLLKDGMRKLYFLEPR